MIRPMIAQHDFFSLLLTIADDRPVSIAEYCSHFRCLFGTTGVIFDGFLCNVQEDAVGAWVQLSTSSDCTAGLRAMTNPHIWRANPTPETGSWFGKYLYF